MSEEQDPQYSSIDEESSDSSEQTKATEDVKQPTDSSLFKNPFYNKNKRRKPENQRVVLDENPDTDSSDSKGSSDTSDFDSESHDDTDEGSEDEIENNHPNDDEDEDSVIKAIKAAREKGERKVPHGLKVED